MGQAAEHHVTHLTELIADSLVKYRVPVAMYGGPPRRHTVDQLAAVGQSQPDAGRGLHQEGLVNRRHRGVGMPDMLPIKGKLTIDRALATVGRCGAQRRSVCHKYLS
jgi:hypothetical protein